ncbi:hypothetical protein, partial [Burkholderia glumae]|uniref:hypothetical protein n=1 Tax=Burkholderia glumae TaxID=337 RepID=UPI0019D71A1F
PGPLPAAAPRFRPDRRIAAPFVRFPARAFAARRPVRPSRAGACGPLRLVSRLGASYTRA